MIIRAGFRISSRGAAPTPTRANEATYDGLLHPFATLPALPAPRRIMRGRRNPYFRRLAGCSVVSRMFSAAPMTSADDPTISGSGPTTMRRSLFG